MAPDKKKISKEELERGPRAGRLQEDATAQLDMEDEMKAEHPEDTQQPPKTKVDPDGERPDG